MPKRQRAVVAAERHEVRLVQQVPAGTAGAYVDPIMGKSWLASRRGLNGNGGFSEIALGPILSDTSEFDATFPLVGNDGIDAGDRFYQLAGSKDPAGGSSRIAYFPGDEWIEVYRGRDEIIASGTPTSSTNGLDPPEVQLHCGDVMTPLKKTRETGSGFWCNAPRDVFEHYSRLWLPVISEDFSTSVAQFPSSPSNTVATTPDGKWQYLRATNQAGPGVVRLHNAASGAYVMSTATWPDSGKNDHGGWRIEARLSQIATVGGCGLVVIAGLPTAYANLGVFARSSSVGLSVPTGTPWPTNTAGIGDASGNISAPLVLAIEARERWVYAYINGQLVGIAPRPPTLTGPLQAYAGVGGSLDPGYIEVDYIVVRRLSAPLNGGSAGDYTLPSVPAPGGLASEYFDLSMAAADDVTLAPKLAPAPWSPGAIVKIGERVDQPDLLPTGAPPTWQYTTLLGAFFVRRTGAVYLPLDTQDVTFALPTAGSDFMRVWVGKTRSGEHILTDFSGDTAVTTSVGMRSLFGSIPGWYPIVIEYYWAPSGGSPGAWTGNSNPRLTWNVGGAGTVVPSTMLAPLGVYRTQVQPGDSHFDTVKAIAEDFAYQFKTQPMALESGSFPGAIVPRVRVGRDTDYVLTISEAIGPQVLVNSEDVAAALMGAAQGLGGNSSGSLTLEAFNFAALLQHPFVSQEYENLPTTTVQGQLLLTLLTLLGLRSAPFEDVQAAASAFRQVQDTFPLTGVLSEFDWQPGDGVRVKCPAVFVDDVLPRQILSLQRLVYVDGVGENRASFRPRNRTPEQTLRKFVRQVYGDKRTFQGQLVNSPGTRAVGGAYSEVVLPTDLSLVRQAQLVVLSKTDYTTTYDVEVNGTVVLSGSSGIRTTGIYNLGTYVARNAGTEPRMVVRLINPSAGGCVVSYQIRLRELVPSV